MIIIVIVIKLEDKICNNIRFEFSSHVSRVKTNGVCYCDISWL